MTRIVGIGGKLASGKDAISDYLVENYGWVKLGMSDALAEALYTLNPYIPLSMTKGDNILIKILLRLGVPLDQWVWGRYADLVDKEGYVSAKKNEEVRRLLQVLGTEVGRRQLSDGSLWTDIMERKVREQVAKGVPGVIVTGIRFPNEVDAISENLDGELWYVTRPSHQEVRSTAAHASENSVNEADFDTTIRNTGTLDDLYAKVDRLVT